MSLISLARRIDRLEYLVRSWRVDHFRRIVEVRKSIDRDYLFTNEHAFILTHGYVPSNLGRMAIFHQLKRFAKRAPPPDHPAWAAVDDLLWYVEPGQKSRWDAHAWGDVWRAIKMFRRMRRRRSPVRSEKSRWLRRELAGLRLHMGEQRLDAKKELHALKGQSGSWVRAVMQDAWPPSEEQRMAMRRAKLDRRRARRRIRKDALLARKALVRAALGKLPAVPIPPDQDLRLFGQPALG